MRMKRVVVTGMGAVSPYGKGRVALMRGLSEGRSAVSRVEALGRISGLAPRVAGVVPEMGMRELPRKTRRSMSAMSVYACMAAMEAMEQAGLNAFAAGSGRMGIAVGSTLGSPETMESFFRQYLQSSGMEQIKSTLFFRIMGHSAAANVAHALGVTGRLMAPTAACSTGCQAIGLAFEAIAFGRQDYMLCGGTDEFHPLVTGTFDLMQAASAGYNDAPEKTPRPFDSGRDGLVCSEGAGILMLESLETAERRGAAVLAEVLGFAGTCDVGSIAEPSPGPIVSCMRQALDDAAVSPRDIAYVNAHATGTELGDIAEGRAIETLFGHAAPISSLKGHMGHTMAAGGALETIACVDMLRTGTFLPTRNLDSPDPRCGAINLIQNPVAASGNLIVKNSFALGGINCSLVLRGKR
jgi:3-oxoacyl-[acyl-carrier-protein] synthase II